MNPHGTVSDFFDFITSLVPLTQEEYSCNRSLPKFQTFHVQENVTEARNFGPVPLTKEEAVETDLEYDLWNRIRKSDDVKYYMLLPYDEWHCFIGFALAQSEGAFNIYY